MALADAALFASVVPPVQHQMADMFTAGQRIAMGARGSLIDELLLRGLAMTGLVWAAMAAGGRRGAGVFWLAILTTALVVYPLKDFAYFAGLDWSALTVLRELTLHGAASVLWGWLYWRHGWLAGLTGHVAAHVALQPLLSIA